MRRSDAVRELVKRVQAAERILLLLDFDGTVAPILDHPSLAYPDADVRRALNGLALDFWQDLSAERIPRVVGGILSGRSIEDVRRRACFSEFAYVGNHGLEIDAFGLKYLNPDANTLRGQLAELCQRIAAATDAIPGAFVENKGLTATIHYRRTPDSLARGLPQILARMLAPVSKLFEIRRAQRAWELLPRTAFHKGSAARWLRDAFGRERLPVYIGDDHSDEDAFGELEDGLTIRVGEPAESLARYWLPDLKAVAAFVSWIRSARGTRSDACAKNLKIAGDGVDTVEEVG